MKKRLIILSDLWGREQWEWLDCYTKELREHFDIECYDCCELGGIDKTFYTEEKLHHQFVNGGIERAVNRLIELEKGAVSMLAFSIGGTIAWRFGLESDRIDRLICISSTRLRNETIKPRGEISLYFGKKDAFKPPSAWFESMDVKYNILNNEEHQFYKEVEFAKKLSIRLIENI